MFINFFLRTFDEIRNYIFPRCRPTRVLYSSTRRNSTSTPPVCVVVTVGADKNRAKALENAFGGKKKITKTTIIKYVFRDRFTTNNTALAIDARSLVFRLDRIFVFNLFFYFFRSVE